MSVVRDKFPPDRLNAIRDFFFQIKSSGLKPVSRKSVMLNLIYLIAPIKTSNPTKKQSSSDTQSHNIGKSDPSIASKFNVGIF